MDAQAPERIRDDEILYRRVPESHYAGRISPSPPPDDAFRPTDNDTNGLSVARALFNTPAQVAAKGRPGKRYFIAAFYVRDLRAKGIEVEAAPLPGDPGHSVLPQLNTANRRDPSVKRLAHILALLCLRVEGPFPVVGTVASDPGSQTQTGG